MGVLDLDRESTIAAMATPLGRSAIGVVRLSGRDAVTIGGQMFRAGNGKPLADQPARTMTLGRIVDPSGEHALDEAMAVVFRGPRSYTGEDLVEFSCHGNPVLLQRIVSVMIQCGARGAERGEFTLRAYLNGCIDLAQAEAVVDLIEAKTPESAILATGQLRGGLSAEVQQVHAQLLDVVALIEAWIDFPEEDLPDEAVEQVSTSLEQSLGTIHELLEGADHGVLAREGARAVICGRPNVGKSSLLNRLLQQDRSIVTHIPGTTRDVIEETANLGGIPWTLVDTAGLTASADPVEQEGVARTHSMMGSAGIIMLVVDSSVPLADTDVQLLSQPQDPRRVVVLNKRDLPAVVTDQHVRQWLPDDTPTVQVSAKTGAGCDTLERTLTSLVTDGKVGWDDAPVIGQTRHREALQRAVDSLQRAQVAVKEQRALECVAADLRAGREALADVLGVDADQTLLDHIFSTFCIGK